MTFVSGSNLRRGIEYAAAIAVTVAIAALVVYDGRIPSPFSSLFFLPIILVAYRHPLPVSLLIAGAASLFSSPAMEAAAVRVDGSVMPVLWLGWPAVYLFLAVSLNQWASIGQQRRKLDITERHLVDVRDRNDRRRQELETLSSIHTVILSGGNEASVVEEITRRIAEVTGAQRCTIMVPVGASGQRPMASVDEIDALFTAMFPMGAPYAEGVAGWAMLHRRVAATGNVFRDPRYERLRQFASASRFAAEAAAPIELDQDLFGALTICYRAEREFTPEELSRLERLARQTELAIRNVRQREYLSRFAFDTALVLTEAIESRDPYTGGHCRRLAEHAVSIASRLALPKEEIEVVGLGAALHDMGKIVVPDSILKKPDRLTPEEYAIVKQHCYSGGQICKRVGFLMDAYPVVYHHHEAWDGSGYPDGLKGERIPIGARIVSVVDALDAMTNDRPYRRGMAFEEAVRILKEGAGRQWDPVVVSALLESLEPELALPPGKGPSLRPSQAAPHAAGHH